MTEQQLIGKTIKAVTFTNPWDAGLVLTFTDGSTLCINEYRGEILVDLDGVELIPDSHKDDNN